MADALDSVVLFNGSRRYAVRLINVSDGTGESGVTKIDISTLTGPSGSAPTSLVIEEIQWDVQGFNSVRLNFDHTTDDEAVVLSGVGYADYRAVGGLKDPSSTGGTGDLLLTTDGNVSGATYNIMIVVRLKD